jgi:flagellar protein FliL
MPTKPDTHAAPAKPDAAAAKAETAASVAPATPAPRSGIAAWLPAIAVVLLAPAVTWATVEFVLIPRLQKQLSAPVPETAAAEPAAGGHGHGKGGKEGKDNAAPNYEFQNIVVNLNGTMGTRYLKTSFLVTGEAGIKAAFETNKPKLTDVTLNVLSSLTLADLEEPGAKNVIREKLVGAYNQALGRKVAEQVYFSDFVIQ